ncbi:cytochrome b561 and DOMON domain-containing protein [Salix suchowensis]|nr:cytochrome b561 and DOMON domain-containing protein [Salix suchowensis]
MSSHRLLILCLILCVQNYSCNEGSLVTAVRRSNDLRGSENAETTNLRSWNGQTALHRRLHLGNTHGVLNIIGWGTLLPIGAIVARSFRKSPLKCDEWFNLHVVCQTLGYIIGSVGWSIGMWLGNSSKQYSLRAHRILGIIIFTSSTAQMFALCLQPKKENERRRWWKICHKILGYLLISMIVANIFQGIGHKDHAEKWKWIYVGILSVLSFCALVLEIFRFVMPRIHR